jgi:hypothetical protein
LRENLTVISLRKAVLQPSSLQGILQLAGNLLLGSCRIMLHLHSVSNISSSVIDFAGVDVLGDIAYLI